MIGTYYYNIYLYRKYKGRNEIIINNRKMLLDNMRNY